MAKISTLTDDFQDNVIDTSKWSVTGGVETSGRAKLTPSTSFAFWAATAFYDLTSSQITADIPAVTPTGTSGTLQCGLSIQRDPNNLIGMRKVGNQLVCSKKVGGVSTDLSFALYDAVNHRYWRIRESAGTIYWETSATGTGTFFIQNTAATSSILFSFAALTPYFFAGYSGFEVSPGLMEIEAVNPGLQITASGSSTSAGSAALLQIFALTGSASSTSAGSAAITIPPLTTHAMTASGASTTNGTAFFVILAPSQMTAAGQSYSFGSVAFRISGTFSATGQSFSTGTAALTILAAPVDSSVAQYFYFEPPIAYDLPPTLPHPRPKYLNAHARWKGGQRRGRSVLKLNGVYVTKDTPTVDQTLAATEVYMGGHIYTIDNITADALTAAGYTVTPIPIHWTLYPGEDVFPEVNLFPGYQELIPDRVAM